jgi:hypothetical protein
MGGLHAMDTVWTAIIGAGGTITAAVITGLFARQASVRNRSYDKVTGSINEPKSNETVPRTLKCSGLVTGMQSGLRLWLAVEVGDLVWPKESYVAPDQNNKWSATVFEDGATNTFAVALFVGDSKVDRLIGKWLEAGRRTGTYSDLKGIPGARRIARVDGLRLDQG